MKSYRPINFILSFVALFSFWLVMSGMFKTPQILQGILSVLIVLAINMRLKRHAFFRDEMDDLSSLRFGFAVFYFFWMIKEILVSGLHVATVLLFRSKRVETYLLTFRVDLPSAHAKMILGNSITLTPGTLTIEIEEDHFTVHAFTKESFQGIIDDTMPKQVLRLFTTEERPVIRDVVISGKPSEAN